jgi:hypothetical protein
MCLQDTWFQNVDEDLNGLNDDPVSFLRWEVGNDFYASWMTDNHSPQKWEGDGLSS